MQEGHLLFNGKKSDPSEAQVDQEGHCHSLTIPSISAILGHIGYQHAIIQNSFPLSFKFF